MTADQRPAVLIAAISGRALAAAARAAGYRPLVADLFGDLDTRALAEAWAVVPGDLERGFEGAALMEALDALAADYRPVGLVYGGGFDGRSALLGALGRRWPLLGNGARVVAAIKDPFRFAEACRALGIPHPAVALDGTDVSGPWLVKRAGGSGGAHVAHYRGVALGQGEYLQALVGERSISALFCAAPGQCETIGFSEQWTDAGATPFVYGGAARPAALDQDLAAHMAAAVEGIASAFGLLGLNSADFRIDRNRYWLVEVNPRPGASLDVFQDPEGQVFTRHIAACQGRAMTGQLRLKGAAVSEILYARKRIAQVPEIDWPHWTADRQPPGTVVEAGAPLCTVIARAESTDEARALAQSRKVEMQAKLEEAIP
ncbi:ATP-grasp domain-containing protein [Rhodoligotrophos defluvii]|uniref:ATP-grasp domain-containing protein n=1 Tax=Rhodoligotrophos defluvii TaxID=2561934 RepID=UPI0010CA0D9E|nr:ATP-grasp domain-containing protein [Rhodoligotrophos defluvii]